MTQLDMNTKIIGATLRRNKRPEWVKEQTRVNDIVVETKKWVWTGHVSEGSITDGH